MARQFSSLSSDLPTEDWQRKYDAVFIETDKLALFMRVEEAEAAILMRCDELGMSLECRPEPQALEHALAQLQAVKNEVLCFRSRV